MNAIKTVCYIYFLLVGNLVGCFAWPGVEASSCQDDDRCGDQTSRCQDKQLLVCRTGADGCLHGAWTDCGQGGCREQDGTAQCAAPPALDALLPSVAQAICDTLFRCCGDSHRERYFASYRFSQRLKDAGFEGRLPPDAPLAVADCPALLAELLQVEPLGPWVAAAQAGEVAYDGLASLLCLDTLQGAACGDAAWSALVDPTCFAHLAPAGGEQQRRMFRRLRGAGESCRGLTDGMGGAVYGTCDPAVAWCCRPDPEDATRCTLVGEAGTCVAVSAAGESCQYFGGSTQVCATGLDCSDLSSQGQGTCLALDGDAPLAAGTACYDSASYSLLGSCQDSYCDLFGSARCEAYREVDESCGEDAECRSGGCEQGRCIEAFCTGIE